MEYKENIMMGMFKVTRVSLTFAVLFLFGCGESSSENLRGVYIAELISMEEIERSAKVQNLNEQEKKVKLHQSTLRAGLPSGQFDQQQESDKFIFGNDESIRFLDNVMNFGGRYTIEGNEIEFVIYGANKPPGENDSVKALQVTEEIIISPEDEYLDWLVFRKWLPKLDYTLPTVAEQGVNINGVTPRDLEVAYQEVQGAIKNGEYEGEQLTDAQILMFQYVFEEYNN